MHSLGLRLGTTDKSRTASWTDNNFWQSDTTYQATKADNHKAFALDIKVKWPA